MTAKLSALFVGLHLVLGLALLPASVSAQPLPGTAEELDEDKGPRTLSLVSWGGRYARTQQSALIDTFVKDGDDVSLKKFKGNLASLGRVSGAWDLVDLELPELEEACERFVVLPLDLDRLDLEPGDLIPGAVHRCGIASQAWSWSFFSTLVRGAPVTIDAFFDADLLDGKRGFLRQPQGLFEMIMLAKGIPADQVYSMLSTPSGLNQALSALGDIREFTNWYYTYADLEKAIKEGEIDQAFGLTSALVRANQDRKTAPLQLVKGPIVYGLDYWALNGNTDNEDTAYAFLMHAVSAEAGIAFAQELAYLPTNSTSYIALNRLPNVPNTQAVLVYDKNWWESAAGKAVIKAFEAWL